MSLVRPWTIGQYQSYALAKVWEGTARIPTQAEMWRQYNATRWSNFRGLFGTGPAQGVFSSVFLARPDGSCFCSSAIHRQYVTWLNNESLEHGGVLVDNFPVQYAPTLPIVFIEIVTITSPETARSSPTTPTKNGNRFA
jgi:hypothetical protein